MVDIGQLVNRQLPRLERSCLTKARFVSRDEARALARHGRHRDGQLSPYHCLYCGLWHLGHRRRRRGRH